MRSPLQRSGVPVARAWRRLPERSGMQSAGRGDGDQFGRVEVRGIDFIPVAERHGDARELFAVWVASNITYLYIVLGGALIGLGLSAWQGIAVVIAGNAFWLMVGLISASGPASGTPSGVVMRAMFGVRGNRANVALVGWATSVAYEAINVSIGALAAFALLTEIGVASITPIKIAVVVVLAVATLTISVYGHATIVRLSGVFTVALAACTVLLLAYVLPHVNLRAVAPGPHPATIVAALIGTTVIASGPFSWNTAADYARYLPPGTSTRAVVWWVGLGGFVPSIVLGIIGVLAGTAIDMTNPQVAFATILPAWFYPVFLAVIVAGSITNNVLTAYSSGLALQAMGVPWSRAITVVFDGAAGVALALYALFSPDFNAALEDILTLSVSLLGPSLAIYAADIVLRRNAYHGPSLHDESPQSPFWYHHGYNWAGITALVIGTLVALACANAGALRGPIANALGGADVSTLAGPLIAVAIYASMTRRTRGVA
jgi:NCS1 family nucleobase:cation symporter-1